MLDHQVAVAALETEQLVLTKYFAPSPAFKVVVVAVVHRLRVHRARQLAIEVRHCVAGTRKQRGTKHRTD